MIMPLETLRKCVRDFNGKELIGTVNCQLDRKCQRSVLRASENLTISSSLL